MVYIRSLSLLSVSRAGARGAGPRRAGRRGAKKNPPHTN